MAGARARRWVVLAVASGLVLGGCGSDDGDDDVDAGEATTTTPGPDDTDATTTSTLGSTTTSPSDAETTTTAAASGTVLELRPDGLGTVDFGRPLEDVLAAINPLFGEPTYTQVCDYTAEPMTCAASDPQGTFVSWGTPEEQRLEIFVAGEGNAFEYYAYSADDVAAATPEGISIGSTGDQVHGAYTGLLRIECDEETYETTIEPAAPGTDGFVATDPARGYGFTIEGGVVAGILRIADSSTQPWRGCV